jgi:hypothetical protein
VGNYRRLEGCECNPFSFIVFQHFLHEKEWSFDSIPNEKISTTSKPIHIFHHSILDNVVLSAPSASRPVRAFG